MLSVQLEQIAASKMAAIAITDEVLSIAQQSHITFMRCHCDILRLCVCLFSSPGPCAITFLHHILRRKVHKLEEGSHLTHGVAWMIASRELFAPISCILLVTHCQMFQE